jgi:hypothetical protein
VEWGAFTLTFIFGYITCKLLYFIKSTRTSLLLIKSAQLMATALLAQALEDFYFAKVYRMEKMVESGETEHNITAFSYQMEEELNYYKKKAIRMLVVLHTPPFDQLLEFDDWPGAMKHLESNKDFAVQFLMRGPND